MKNSNTNENKNKYGNLGFYLVIALCAVMIGVSCWFAYTQTADNLEMQLDSALESANDLTAARYTQPAVTETQTPETSAHAAVYVPAAEEKAAETNPETTALAAAVPLVSTETIVTETTAVSVPVYPLAGEIIGEFSNGELVKSSTTGVWQTHNGVDIAGSLGDEVCAMDSGIVEAVEEDPLWGVCVTIDHRNGFKSRYCSLNAGLAVNVGDSVSAGMVIGAVGDTADMESSLGAHLHFEVMNGKSYIAPAEYIGN